MLAQRRKIIKEKATALGIDTNLLPNHIAVIMDGNGRWASTKGFSRIIGHKNGYDVFHNIIENASDLGLKHLTLYAFSTENWKRPKTEVNSIFNIMVSVAQREIRFAHENNVKVRIIGRLNELDNRVRDALLRSEEETKNYDGLQLSVAVNYGGRAELLDAVKKIMDEKIDPDNLDESMIKERLYYPDMPDVDLLIRTSGEMRWSNFLIWQAAYAEFYTTTVNWPDFKTEDFLQSIYHYQLRHRRFGAL